MIVLQFKQQIRVTEQTDLAHSDTHIKAQYLQREVLPMPHVVAVVLKTLTQRTRQTHLQRSRMLNTSGHQRKEPTPMRPAQQQPKIRINKQILIRIKITPKFRKRAVSPFLKQLLTKSYSQTNTA